jgi:hypothetical protein
MQDSELKMRPQICQDWEAESALLERPVSLRANEIKFAVLALVSPWLIHGTDDQGSVPCNSLGSRPRRKVCLYRKSFSLSVFVCSPASPELEAKVTAAS